MMNEFTLSAAVLGSYLLGYTMYSKKEKRLHLPGLLDVLFVRRGLDHTLVELNKAISLAGLTTLGLAYLPWFGEMRTGLVKISFGTLAVHSAYSTFKFYGGKNIPGLSTWHKIFSELLASKSGERAIGIKKLSILLGIAATTANFLEAAGTTRSASVALASVALGFAHFYSMEVDYKLKLQVRPFAYAAVLVPVLAAANLIAQAMSGAGR